MPEPAPDGILPIFIRGSLLDKYGFKTGPGVMDLIDYIYLPKDEILKEIQDFGVMSDFEPAKKQIEMSQGDKILIVIDKDSRFGEVFLIYYSESAKEQFKTELQQHEFELEIKRRAEEEAEEARKAEEWARLNVVFEDVPLSPRPWPTTTTTETENDIKVLNPQPVRERLSVEVFRTKKHLRASYRFGDTSGLQEFRAHKDPHFTAIRESDIGIQAAPSHLSSSAQTTWFRLLNKGVQYESASVQSEPVNGDSKIALCEFLESATMKIELALQQNETVDIFHETFRMTGDEEMLEGPQAENELRELKNFADPTYSKFKVLSAIDWMPKSQGFVAVSAVRNMSFDQRITVSGQTHTSYILLWDFRQLVRPQVLLQCPHEVFTFRFNATNPNIIVGGCITGQVVLWDISDAIAAVARKGNRGSTTSGSGSSSSGANSNAGPETEEDDATIAPVAPKWTSNVDHSHRRAVADLLWLPPNTQINHRGHLVADEYLDNQSHQFITVAGDGQVMVWDTRYEAIANDELRHIGRSKHIHTEKTAGKEGPHALWTPIFKAHLKRLEGVGELSLCKVSVNFAAKSSSSSSSSAFKGGDPRSQLMIGTEEGDILLSDLSSRKVENNNSKEEEDDELADSKEFVRWIAKDHARPSVCVQHSPFFPDIVLTIGDLKFNLWKIGEAQPLFTSPMASTYLTGGAWSPTRPAVLILSCMDGSLLAWDFTDSSYRHSIELKATHSHISSMEFLPSSTSGSTVRQQLLAVGDITGTLHVFEIPRNLSRPVHKEESLMTTFFEREIKRVNYLKENRTVSESNDNDDRDRGNGNGFGNVDTNGLSSQRIETSNQMDDPKSKTENVEMIKKDEEDFAKLEALFISELGLSTTELPSYLPVSGKDSSSQVASQLNPNSRKLKLSWILLRGDGSSRLFVALELIGLS
eukprot:gene5133-10260_t